MPETRAPAARRPLNVSLLAGSGAHRAYYDRSGSSVSELTADELASGFPPQPALNFRYFGGRTITHLVFANHYLGGNAAWAPADIASDLADGSGAVPVQLMWSNKHDAPATRIA